MRVLHISKYDTSGGASRAAYNSVTSQRRAGIDASLLVGVKNSDMAFIHTPPGVSRFKALLWFVADKAPAIIFSKWDARSLHLFGLRALSIERAFGPDLVVLHNIDGLVPVRAISRFTVPVVWRTHDMWPICGARHYQPDEEVIGEKAPKWTGNAVQRSLDSALYRHKSKIYASTQRLSLCPPSSWLAGCLEQSPIFDRPPNVRVIPNGIDTDTFRPLPSDECRARLGIAPNEKVILFGAVHGGANPRKGFDLLLAALQRLTPHLNANTRLLVFGAALPKQIAELGLPSASVGTITDDSALAGIYSAADVFVAPSRQENLSLTVLEALSCGTPVVAFDVGGMPDMISSEYNGWLAQPYDVTDLAERIHQAVSLPDDVQRRLRSAARETVCQRFSMQTEAAAMLDLYNRTLEEQVRSTAAKA